MYQQYYIYPAPAGAKLNASFNDPGQGGAYLEVFNNLGSIVYEKSLDRMESGHTVILENIPGLPSGIYYYRIKSDSNLHTGKFVIN